MIEYEVCFWKPGHRSKDNGPLVPRFTVFPGTVHCVTCVKRSLNTYRSIQSQTILHAESIC